MSTQGASPCGACCRTCANRKPGGGRCQPPIAGVAGEATERIEQARTASASMQALPPAAVYAGGQVAAAAQRRTRRTDAGCPPASAMISMRALATLFDGSASRMPSQRLILWTRM